MGDIVSGLHAGAKHGVWRLMQTFLREGLHNTPTGVLMR